MPTYTYRCPNNHEFDEFSLKLDDTEEILCPECKERAGRIISGHPVFKFKGPGFYATRESASPVIK